MIIKGRDAVVLWQREVAYSETDQNNLREICRLMFGPLEYFCPVCNGSGGRMDSITADEVFGDSHPFPDGCIFLMPQTCPHCDGAGMDYIQGHVN